MDRAGKGLPGNEPDHPGRLGLPAGLSAVDLAGVAARPAATGPTTVKASDSVTEAVSQGMRCGTGVSLRLPVVRRLPSSTGNGRPGSRRFTAIALKLATLIS